MFSLPLPILCLPPSIGPEPAAERGQVRRHHHPHPRAAQRLAGEEERETEASQVLIFMVA